MKSRDLFRLTQWMAVLFFGLYAFIVAFGNITDYRSNLIFVEGVLTMSTTFDENNLMWRAIESTFIHHLIYILIISTEIIIAVLSLIGSYKMIQNLKKDTKQFQESKRYGIVGLLLGFFLWFFGFQIIAGEWFAMWQSEIFNALDSAFRITTYIMLSLILLFIKEP